MSACNSPDPRIVEEKVGKVPDSFTCMNQQRMKQLNFTNLIYTLEMGKSETHRLLSNYTEIIEVLLNNTSE